MSYLYALGPDEKKGTINEITVRWQASALTKLDDAVKRTEQTSTQLKALTENFLYLAALSSRKYNCQGSVSLCSIIFSLTISIKILIQFLCE